MTEQPNFHDFEAARFATRDRSDCVNPLIAQFRPTGAS